MYGPPRRLSFLCSCICYASLIIVIKSQTAANVAETKNVGNISR